jgi:hypothetical protein
MNRCLFLIAYTLLAVAGSTSQAESLYPTIKLSEVPNAVLQMYKREEPNFTDMSHCATAWDSTTDGDKIAFKCSVFIKMSAEGERRAMRYCDEIREQKKISARCRLIVVQ